MLKLDGKTLPYDRAFTHNNINYPRNWIRLTSSEEKQAIGITEVADPANPSYNQKFYWGVNKPKDIDQLKVDPELVQRRLYGHHLHLALLMDKYGIGMKTT